MEKNRLVDHDRETFHPERTKSTTRTTALVQVQLEPTDDLRLLEMNLEVDSREDGSDETCHADISVRTADSKPGQEQVRVISDIFVDSNRNRSTSRSTNTLNYLAICARNNRHRTSFVSRQNFLQESSVCCHQVPDKASRWRNPTPYRSPQLLRNHLSFGVIPAPSSSMQHSRATSGSTAKRFKL